MAIRRRSFSECGGSELGTTGGIAATAAGSSLKLEPRAAHLLHELELGGLEPGWCHGHVQSCPAVCGQGDADVCGCRAPARAGNQPGLHGSGGERDDGGPIRHRGQLWGDRRRSDPLLLLQPGGTAGVAAGELRRDLDNREQPARTPGSLEMAVRPPVVGEPYLQRLRKLPCRAAGELWPWVYRRPHAPSLSAAISECSGACDDPVGSNLHRAPSAAQTRGRRLPSAARAVVPPQLSWDLGDGAGSTATTVTRSYGDPGTYLVSLAATNTAGTLSTVRTLVVQGTGGGAGPMPVPSASTIMLRATIASGQSSPTPRARAAGSPARRKSCRCRQ